MTPETKLDFERRAAEAGAHAAAGRLAEAEALYRAALALAPDHPAVQHNLGVVLARGGDHRAALALFDAALAREPGYASAHFNRAVALEQLGARREAIVAYGRAVAADPSNYAAHRARAFALLAEGDRGRAMDHFAATYDLRRGEERNGMARRSMMTASAAKLEHDAAQFRYLARSKRNARELEAMARTYEELAKTQGDSVRDFTEDELEQIGARYNTPIYLGDAPELPGGAIALRPDRAEITARFRETGAVAFDNLLTPAAFDMLRGFLLDSTIWHDFSHIDGFVASYLEDGLASPLLLQIVDELRAALPDVLGPHPLTQAWAFKASAPKVTIEAHADDGAVSVNFWMTPAAANLNPAQGGMRIALAAPEGPAPADYRSDRDRAVHFLERNRENSFVAGYKENRAVLFSSRLVHASDAPDFEQTYENKRINITLVFGKADAVSARTSSS